ncbi:MAG: tRNA (adenosine(37)-N6)-threonylcarbamoyltransferase complex ATPase subunit type 1 TsaE [Nitrospinae bacterium]|nr:tRNA (adenosine(37)-N6)-threonylcarbamoyltransferase complex ATPase subunit type 1 TsaE [Nitrospinota bacterium]
MKEIIVISRGPEATVSLGKGIGALLKPPDVVSLFGDFGSGKTCLIQGIVRGLGGSDEEYVRSPGYTLMNQYVGKVPIFHFDLFRINDLSEIEELNLEGYFYDDGVTVIEWAEKIHPLLPINRLDIRLVIIGEKEREITLIPRAIEHLFSLHSQISMAT